MAQVITNAEDLTIEEWSNLSEEQILQRLLVDDKGSDLEISDGQRNLILQRITKLKEHLEFANAMSELDADGKQFLINGIFRDRLGRNGLDENSKVGFDHPPVAVYTDSAHPGFLIIVVEDTDFLRYFAKDRRNWADIPVEERKAYSEKYRWAGVNIREYGDAGNITLIPRSTHEGRGISNAITHEKSHYLYALFGFRDKSVETRMEWRRQLDLGNYEQFIEKTFASQRKRIFDELLAYKSEGRTNKEIISTLKLYEDAMSYAKEKIENLFKEGKIDEQRYSQLKERHRVLYAQTISMIQRSLEIYDAVSVFPNGRALLMVSEIENWPQVLEELKAREIGKTPDALLSEFEVRMQKKGLTITPEVELEVRSILPKLRELIKGIDVLPSRYQAIAIEKRTGVIYFAVNILGAGEPLQLNIDEAVSSAEKEIKGLFKLNEKIAMLRELTKSLDEEVRDSFETKIINIEQEMFEWGHLFQGIFSKRLDNLQNEIEAQNGLSSGVVKFLGSFTNNIEPSSIIGMEMRNGVTILHCNNLYEYLKFGFSGNAGEIERIEQNKAIFEAVSNPDSIAEGLRLIASIKDENDLAWIKEKLEASGSAVPVRFKTGGNDSVVMMNDMPTKRMFNKDGVTERTPAQLTEFDKDYKETVNHEVRHVEYHRKYGNALEAQMAQLKAQRPLTPEELKNYHYSRYTKDEIVAHMENTRTKSGEVDWKEIFNNLLKDTYRNASSDSRDVFSSDADKAEYRRVVEKLIQIASKKYETSGSIDEVMDELAGVDVSEIVNVAQKTIK